jgi:hypothetical protein
MARDGERAEALIRKHVGGKKAYNLRGRTGGAA